jgi:hypothetical protein
MISRDITKFEPSISSIPVATGSKSAVQERRVFQMKYSPAKGRCGAWGK